MIGNISSDVDKNTATNVPTDITPVAYKELAAAEKPHSGTKPNKLATRGAACK